ncbi:MAG: lipid A biosynthesis lauroyl acyltransferase [Gammaproteobacteria bacterium]|nr:lipid A biosynthesis lauroyl acyltransferase [Gammaproteobacteria bacterium]MDH4253675.1 lipid A biosynthesis lauroyl acyltransferase [Gammaproteobacteria bacterium]MDH5311332.1 lipid A biosynthesis lauroyl acyltransferase [Gammaproteobacteria bacterium]
MKKTDRVPLSHFWTPPYWPAWFGLLLLRMTCLLPFRVQIGLGKFLGRVLHRLAAKRRAITRRNLALAFPELSDDERNRLARAHFEALGASLMELGLGRWASDEKLLAITRIEGTEHIDKAVREGRGIILLSAHFTSLEVSGRVLRLRSPPFDAVFRRHRSQFLTEVLRTGREVSARRTIEKSDIKSMVRSLREGTPVWYAPDQSYNRKQSALIPFFGIPAMTNTATGTLARLGNAVTLPFFPTRLPDGGYLLSILPPIEDFPSDDPVEDTKKYVAILEQQIRRCPEQYYWIHRKFKNLPPPYPDYYADLDAWK